MELKSGKFPLYGEIEQEIRELFDFTLQQKNELSKLIEQHILTAENQLHGTKRLAGVKVSFIQNSLEQIKATNDKIETVLVKIKTLKSLLQFIKNGSKNASVNHHGFSFEITCEKGKLISLALAQLKLIKKEYSSLSNTLNQLVLKLWLDREIASFLKLYLINFNQIVGRFLLLADRAEVAMADLFTISETEYDGATNDDNMRVVIRMLTYWFKTEPELNLIHELFPEAVTNV